MSERVEEGQLGKAEERERRTWRKDRKRNRRSIEDGEGSSGGIKVKSEIKILTVYEI